MLFDNAASSTSEVCLPWLTNGLFRILGAVGATIGGTMLVMDPSKLGPLYNHAMPGENYHGEGHDEEHEEGEEGEEGGEEGGEESSGGAGGEASEQQSEGSDSEESQQSGGDETPDTSADEESPSNEKTQAGRNKPGEQGLGKGKLEQATELPPGQKGERRFLIPDSKGGNMRRVESPKGVALGHGQGATSGKSVGDVKQGSSPAAGQTPPQQKGVSNTDTKHSEDIMAAPDKSKKSEGVPETAKLQVSWPKSHHCPLFSLY